MFLTLCSHYTVPPWWKQSFHPCFECSLHSKTDRFNCTHSYSARQCSDPCISEQSSTLMNEASYCMYNTQHFISLRSSIVTSKSLLFPLQGDSIADQPHRLNQLLSIEVDALDNYAIWPPIKKWILLRAPWENWDFVNGYLLKCNKS